MGMLRVTHNCSKIKNMASYDIQVVAYSNSTKEKYPENYFSQLTWALETEDGVISNLHAILRYCPFCGHRLPTMADDIEAQDEEYSVEEA